MSKALLISSATLIVSFDMVLFSMCSAVTVECCVLYQCCMDEFGMFYVMFL